jgi:hypothetical protein
MAIRFNNKIIKKPFSNLKKNKLEIIKYSNSYSIYKKLYFPAYAHLFYLIKITEDFKGLKFS